MNLQAEDILHRFCIALTGGIATGKSTVAGLLREAGFVVIDADQLARKASAPGTPAHAATMALLGPGILAPDGSLDRRKIGSIVFGLPARLADLEAIMIPAIRAALAAEVLSLQLPRHRNGRAEPFFFEAALIFERNRAQDFLEVWATWCPPDIQQDRLIQRDHLDHAAARQRLERQMDPRAKAEAATWMIRTDQPLELIRSQLLERITSLKLSDPAH